MHTITDHNPENNHREGEHILVSLTYIAKKTERNSGVDFTRALECWRRYYKENDITSALIVNDNYFIQNIQGSRPAINRALAKILDEYLDILPHVVEIKEIEVHTWNGYLLKYLTSSDQDEEYTLKSFSAGADFNPYLMKKTQIASFLTAIFAEKESQVDGIH